MKKLYLSTFAAVAALLSLASCVQKDPYVETIDVPETLTYVGSTFDEAQVIHRTILSASKFNSVFPIKVNKAKHDEVRATLVYDKDAADAYNAKNGTTYPILDEIAKARGQKLSQMALAWVLRDEVVTSALIGASRPEQILENVEAVNAAPFTDAELAAIDAILAR